MDSNYSLSDLSAVTGNNGWGGNNSIVTLLLLFALISGNGLFNNRGDYAQFATSASQQEILFGQRFDSLGQKINSIGDGICSSTYALNNAIKDGNAAVAGAVVTEGRNMQNLLSTVRYDMANFASAINANIDNKFASLEKAQMQAQIDAQAREINQLYIAQQMCGVVRYPNGMTYTAGTSPFCNNGCGYCG